MIDKELKTIIDNESVRQNEGLEMIASENYTSNDVLSVLGSILTNKYSEGQPGRRYYGGNQFIDQLELLCKKRALNLFSLSDKEWSVNVQPYSGSSANFAVYTALLKPNDRIMGLDLPSGGHLTHGFYNGGKNVSATSIFFQSLPYEINKETGLIDYDEMENRALLFRPKCIIAGGSAYPRDWDYKRISEIAKMVKAILLVDMAHTAGLIASECLNNPFLYADVVTTTTHKSLRGPRAGMIFSKIELSPKIDFAVFPSLQGGPHNNTIGAIAVALKEAQQPSFKEYSKQVIRNCKKLGDELIEKGYDLITGGTDTHLILINLKPKGLTGSKAEFILEQVGITVNKNTIIGDKSALSPSGIRIGMCALTTRGVTENDCIQIANYIDSTLMIAQTIETKLLKDFKFIVQTLMSCEYNNLQDIKNKVREFSLSLKPI